MNPTKQGERVVQERIVGIDGDAWKLGDDGLDFGNGRELGEFHKRNLARVQVRVLNHRTAEEELASGVVRGQGTNRVSAQSRVFIDQRLLMRVFVERADSFERPQRVDRACSISARAHAFLQPRRGVRHLVVHDQSLRREAPELVATVERRHEFGSLRLRERLDGAFRTVLPDDAVNATVRLVTQVALGHVSATAFGRGLNARGLNARRRVVLDDEAVEIDHPNRAVGTDIGEDRRHPFIAAGKEIETIERLVATAVALNIHDADELGSRLIHQRLPEQARRQCVADHEGMSRRGRVAAEVINHAHIRRVGMHTHAGSQRLGGGKPANTDGSAIARFLRAQPIAGAKPVTSTPAKAWLRRVQDVGGKVSVERRVSIGR